MMLGRKEGDRGQRGGVNLLGVFTLWDHVDSAPNRIPPFLPMSPDQEEDEGKELRTRAGALQLTLSASIGSG